MSRKLTCPGCDSRSSSVLTAFLDEEPCPGCGMAADAMAERMDPLDVAVLRQDVWWLAEEVRKLRAEGAGAPATPIAAVRRVLESMDKWEDITAPPANADEEGYRRGIHVLTGEIRRALADAGDRDRG